MALITKAMIGIVSPILTYTMDELLEYAPSFIKDDAEDNNADSHFIQL